MEINNRNIIKTSHELNHFRGGYTPLELDFIYSFISCIKNEDDELHEYILTLDELEKKLDKRLRVERVEKIFDSLVTKSFKVNNAEELTVYSFFTKMKFDKKEDTISVKFNPELKPHLLKLKTYAMGNLKYILSFRGEYSKRLYMLLSQWRTAGKATYTVEELREMLAVPKSYLYADIKGKIIKKTQTEFRKKSPFSFEFKEIKKGKRVEKITFVLKQNFPDIEEFKELISSEHFDQKLYEFDNRMTYSDKDAKLYWVNDDLQRIYHNEEYAENCWAYLIKNKNRLPIFNNPSLFKVP